MIHPKKQSGFTLIEMLVSLGVFSVVITTAVGALLMLVATNNQLQGEQSVMTNLSFALDSMTREIRTGTGYYCDEANNYSVGGPSGNIFADGNNLDAIIGPDEYQDCAGRTNVNRSLHGIAFLEGGDSVSGTDDRILFFHVNDRQTATAEDAGRIYRRVGNGDAVPITASSIYIHRAEFFVTGSAPANAPSGPTDDHQASVTIQIEASEAASTPVEERVTLQTTISQRTLDI